MVAKLQGDISASQSSMELYYPWISGPLRVSDPLFLQNLLMITRQYQLQHRISKIMYLVVLLDLQVSPSCLFGASVHCICSNSKLQVAAPTSLMNKTCNKISNSEGREWGVESVVFRFRVFGAP